MEKREVRKLIKQRKKEQSSEMLRAWDQVLAEHVVRQLAQVTDPTREWRIGLFLSLPDEVQTAPIIERITEQLPSCVVLVPRVLPDNQHILFFEFNDHTEMSCSSYGIQEPTTPDADAMIPDILVLPGIAFDPHGGRVGHGGGFYDRYLEEYGGVIRLKVGIAYDFQVLDEVPMEPLDQRVDMLITDAGIRYRRCASQLRD